MKLKNAEHLTRYTVSFEGKDYIRLVEKSVNGTQKISWLMLFDETIYQIGDEDEEKLELEFEKLIQ